MSFFSSEWSCAPRSSRRSSRLFARPPPVRKIESADATRDGWKRSLISSRARRENDATSGEQKFPTVKLIGTHHLFECQPSVARHWKCVVLCGRACTFILQTVVGLQQFREAVAGVLVMRCATVCRFPVQPISLVRTGRSSWAFTMNAVCVVIVTCRSLSFLCGKSSGRQSSPLRGWQKIQDSCQHDLRVHCQYHNSRPAAACVVRGVSVMDASCSATELVRCHWL